MKLTAITALGLIIAMSSCDPVVVPPCGQMPDPQSSYYFSITKSGELFSKDAASVFRMDEVGPANWAVCNAAGQPIKIRFAAVECQGQSVPQNQCPVDWDTADSEKCAGRVHAVNSTSITIPKDSWGVIGGSANPNRLKCRGDDDDPDKYGFKVFVTGEGGDEHQLDPQIQIDRDNRIWLIYLYLILGGMALLGLGYWLARRLRSGKRDV